MKQHIAMAALAAVLTVAAAPAAFAQPAPSKTIDSKASPGAAADILTTFCGDDIKNCQWVTNGKFTGDYGPERIIGDAAYNCTDPGIANANIEAATGFEEEREESTSVQETLKLKLSLGLIGLADSSAEFEAFSKQAGSTSTAAEVTNEVTVVPGWKGYTTYRVPSANANGSVYVTDGISVIAVSNIDVSFPGYVLPNQDSTIRYISNKKPMTDQEYTDHCKAVVPTAAAASRALVPNPVTRATFGLELCTGETCTTRKVTGARPAARRGTATLLREGRAVAKGRVGDGRIRLRAGTLAAGTYQLVIAEPETVTKRSRTHEETRVNITVR
ncbi:hypothetical protein [Solirubrobacter soli]|uniref:hypothetical protein n=1 Tax=Solirubrobacter soli TaxID=363832 RepID=UPI00040BB8CD|nr:hypothetical protein [Solirubrobacter soli]